MKKHLLSLILFAGLLFCSCDSIFNNSDSEAQTGSITFAIHSMKAALEANEVENSPYDITVKISGDNVSEEKKIKLETGKSASVEFKGILIGTKIIAEVEIYQNDKLIYKGKSDEYIVQAGENKVTVVLEKQQDNEEEKQQDDEEEKPKIAISGSIIFPDLMSGFLSIQIDEEKTADKLYLNRFEVVLKANDLSGKNITDGINWNVSLSYQDNEINTNQSTLYEFDSERQTLRLTTNTQTGNSNYLGTGGLYQIYAVATYNGSKSCANFYISVEDKFIFDIYLESELEHDEQLDHDFFVLKEDPILDLVDYITENKCKKIDFKFHGSFNDETMYIIPDAILLLQKELFLQEEIPVLKYALDLSDLEGFTQVPEHCFELLVEDGDGNMDCNENKFLTKVVLPETVTSLGEDAFNYCTKLESVNIPEGITTISAGCFSDCNSLSTISIPDSVNEIGGSAFLACTKLTSIEIPDGVERIEDSTFKKCTALYSIVIPDSVVFIGDNAFDSCWTIEEIDIPHSVTYIGKGAFQDCKNLRAIVVPQGVTEIKDSCFCRCYLLEECTLPSSIETIGNDSFSDCRELSRIELPENITIIKSNCFYKCNSLESIIIPANVTRIENSAFSSCKNLSSLTFEEGSVLTIIDSYAFSQSSSLSNVIITIPKTVKVIDSYAFSDTDAIVTLEAESELKVFAGSAFRYINGLEGTWKYASYNNWYNYCNYWKGGEVPEGYDPSTITGTTENFSPNSEGQIYIGGNYTSRYYFKSE